MELRQLRAVLAIADTGSVTKAAELLHVVQPAISRQLRLIEEELGKPLFVRAHGGMTPTEEGRLFIEHARRAMLTLQQAVTEISPPGDVIAGLVSVGFLPSVCDLLAGDLLRILQRAFPHIRLRLTTGFPGQLQQWVEEGSLDLALLYDVKSSGAVLSAPLLDEPLYLVGLRETAALEPHPLPVSALKDLPLILPSSSHTVRGIVEHACALGKVPLTVVAEADATQLTKALLLGGIGYTVLAGVALADPALQDRVVAAPLGQPPLQRRITLATSAMRHNSAPVRCVSSLLKARIRELVEDGSWPGARLVDF